MKTRKKIIFFLILLFSKNIYAQLGNGKGYSSNLSSDGKFLVIVEATRLRFINTESNKTIWQVDSLKNQMIFATIKPFFLKNSNLLLVKALDLAENMVLYAEMIKAKNEWLIAEKSVKEDKTLNEQEKTAKIGKVALEYLVNDPSKKLVWRYFIYDCVNGNLIRSIFANDNSQIPPVYGEIKYVSEDESFFVEYYNMTSKIKVWDFNTGLELNTFIPPSKKPGMSKAYQGVFMKNDNKTIVFHSFDFASSKDSLEFIDCTDGKLINKLEFKNCPKSKYSGVLTSLYSNETIYVTAKNDEPLSADPSEMLNNMLNNVESNDYSYKVDINTGNLIEKLEYKIWLVSKTGDAIVYKNKEEIMYENLKENKKYVLKEMPLYKSMSPNIIGKNCLSMDDEGKVISFVTEDGLKFGIYDFKKSENVIWINN
jgi:hypothetical protein